MIDYQFWINWLNLLRFATKKAKCNFLFECWIGMKWRAGTSPHAGRTSNQGNWRVEKLQLTVIEPYFTCGKWNFPKTCQSYSDIVFIKVFSQSPFYIEPIINLQTSVVVLLKKKPCIKRFVWEVVKQQNLTLFSI